MPDLDDISDRNLGAALWVNSMEEEFADFDSLGDLVQEFWIEQARQFRALLALIMQPAKVLPFPPPKEPIAVTTYPEGFRP